MLPRKNFMGEIEGESIYDLTKDLNYGLDFKERLDNVKERLDDMKDFFENVFEQEFDENINVSNIKLILNKKDALYSETNVAKQLEKMGSYLIAPYDKEHPTNDKIEYAIITDSMQKKINDKEISENSFKNDDDENIMLFVKDEGLNYKKEILQKVIKKDLDNTYCGDVLKDYYDMIAYCKSILSTFKKLKDIYVVTDGFKYFDLIENENMKCNVIELKDLLSEEITIAMGKEAYRCRKIVKELICDQVYTKDKLKGVIYFKQPLADSKCTDYDKMDFTNPSHVKELLRIKCGDNFKEDLNCLVYDLENILNKCEFNEIEKIILHYWRKTECTQDEISKLAKVNQSSVSRTLDKITDKIIEQYKEDYNDWYYLNVEKGSYKKCPCCGEVKLIDKFRKRSDNKGDGYRNVCKSCEKVKKM